MNLYASLETAIGQASGFSLLANNNSQIIHVIMSVIGNKVDSISRSSLNVLFNGWSLVRHVISFLNCFAQYNISKDGFYCGSMGKREKRECCKWKESRWRRGVKETTVDISTGTNEQGSSGHLKSYDFESLWWLKISIFVTWSKTLPKTGYNCLN